MSTNNNKPDHQHFIPRSYLRNFAELKKKKKFVDIIELKTGRKIYASTKDVCVKSGLYSLPSAPGDKKYIIEKHYAESVDDVYPEVYQLLIDKAKTRISNNQKHKILYTLMSMYFRTPKFLHGVNKMTDDVFEWACAMTDQSKQEIRIDMEGRKFTFLRSELEQVKKRHREENRLAFLSTHFEAWHEFVTYKYDCGISVFEIEGDIELITADNPVIIHSSVGNRFHLFDPTNIIEVPLDRRHFLWIYPNTEHPGENRILRAVRDKWFALLLNWKVQHNAETLIVGYPGTVEKHIEDQKKYGEVNEENMKAVDNIRQSAMLMNELLELAQKYGFASYAVAEKVRQFRKMECFQGNTDLQYYVEELAKCGFLTV